MRRREFITLTQPWVRSIGLAAAVGLAYFLAAIFSLRLILGPSGVAVFWPAAGISSGILIALGPRVRCGVGRGDGRLLRLTSSSTIPSGRASPWAYPMGRKP
jgi:integral membrane sensor domain MASE1